MGVKLMGKVLDIGVFQDKTIKVKLPEGKILRLRKPTERMAIAAIALRQIDEGTEQEEVIRALNAIAIEILNNNDEGLKFTQEDMEYQLSVDDRLNLISVYEAFIEELQSNPN